MCVVLLFLSTVLENKIFASALGQWVVRSIPHGGPTELFSSRQCFTKAMVCTIPFVAWCIKRTFAANRKACGGSVFPLSLRSP